MENEIKNNTLYDYNPEDIKETPEVVDAVLVRIEETTAKEIFGEKAKKPETKMFKCFFENDEHDIRSDLNMTFFEKGNVPDCSKLAKFIKRHGGFQTGTKVKLVKNETGFYDVAL